MTTIHRESGATWNTLGIRQARIAKAASTAKARRNAWSAALYYWIQGIESEPSHLPCILNRLHALWVLGISFTFMEEAIDLLNELELNPESWKNISPPNVEGYELAWRDCFLGSELVVNPDLSPVDQYIYYLARWIAERVGLPYQAQTLPFWQVAAELHPGDLQARAVTGLLLSKNLRIEGIQQLRQNISKASNDTYKKWADICYRIAKKFIQLVQWEAKESGLRLKTQSVKPEIIEVRCDNYIVKLEGDLRSVTTHCYLVKGRWFEAEIDFVRSYLKPGSTFVDVGANIGSYTLAAADIVGPSGRVIAFEPTEKCVEILRCSAKSNQFSQVTVIPYAIGREVGKAYFLESEDSVYNHLVDSLTGITQPVKIVQKTTLDDWWNSSGKPSVDMIKIDIASDPIDALRGSQELIKAYYPIIQIETRTGKGLALPQVSSYLSDLGYRFFAYNPTLNELSIATTQARSLFVVNLVAVPEARFTGFVKDLILEEKPTPKKLDSKLLALLEDPLEVNK